MLNREVNFVERNVCFIFDLKFGPSCNIELLFVSPLTLTL